MVAAGPFARALAARVRGRVDDDDLARALYATDASLYEIAPRAVLRAAEPDDLVAAVEAAREHGVPITARGAGTSLAGQAVGPGLVIDCRDLDAIEIEAEARAATVGPGVVLDALNAAAAPHRLWFGPDTATSNRCTLGGMIGNNSCGARSLWYGMTVEHVESLEVVLADGSVAAVSPREIGGPAPGGLLGEAWRAARGIADGLRDEIRARYPPIPRRASGYNLDRLLGDRVSLASLIVGSEGTLALVRRARVRLVPKPAHVGAVAVHFGDLDAALEAVGDLLALTPAAVELLDRAVLDLARDSLAYSRHLGWLDGRPEAVLLVEFLADDVRAVASLLDEAIRLTGARASNAVRLTEHERDDAWRIRRAGLPLLYAAPGPRRPLPFVEDVSVPPEHMPAFVRAFRDVVAGHGTTAAFYAHAAAGCLHVRPMIDPADVSDRERMLALQRDVADLARSFGGAMSGEHGDGRIRGHLLEAFFGPEIVGAFATLKRAFDPEGLLNPGVIVEPPDPLADLRAPARPHGDERLRWEEGFPASVERCFGAGVCLKRESGSMCPSFMVTGAEEDSTRARANAFRAVLSGTVAAEELYGSRFRDVMDLCVGCKACKAECPAGVDVAAMKVEYLARRRRRDVRPRDRLVARADALLRFGGRAPGAANAFARVAWPVARRLGFGRPPPRLSRRTLTRSLAGAAAGEGPVVTLFADTFSQHLEPHVGVAAHRLLVGAGYRVEVLAGVCCGRPAISSGAVGRARAQARRMGQALVRARGPVVFLEPSCWSAVADDHPMLGVIHDVDAVLLEGLVAREPERFAAVLEPGDDEALVHVHCHQRALAGTAPALDAVGLAGRAVFCDAGCCGMAGSFGYEAEHQEISRAMAERVLLPAARAAGGPVIATGVSCRQQLASLGGIRAVHPAELLAARLRA